MLQPDDWKTLYQDYKRLRKKAQRSPLPAEESMEFRRVAQILTEHDDGTDPCAPLGGLSMSYTSAPPTTSPQKICFFPLDTWRAIVGLIYAAYHHPKRWLFYSLRANAGLCFVAFWVIRYFYFVNDVAALWLATRLLGGTSGLALAAWAVLCYERRARRAQYARECAAIREYERQQKEELEMAAAAAQAPTAAATEADYSAVTTATGSAPVAVMRQW